MCVGDNDNQIAFLAARCNGAENQDGETPDQPQTLARHDFRFISRAQSFVPGAAPEVQEAAADLKGVNGMFFPVAASHQVPSYWPGSIRTVTLPPRGK